MTHNMKLISFLVLILFIASCTKADKIQLTKKKWTFLLYDDADFTNAFDPLTGYPYFLPFAKFVSSNDQINYLVLNDRENTEASYIRIGENHEQETLEELGEVNMGDKNTLRDFIEYAKENYPAERYIIAFYDHGGGWQGTCWDKTDNLTMKEMSDAMSEAGGIDITMFTAPCLMGAIETVYQLRNSTEYCIGSEDLSGFSVWVTIFESFHNYVTSNSNVSTVDLVKKIITLIDENSSFGQLTMSAVDVSKTTQLITSFDNVCKYYLTNVSKFKEYTKAGPSCFFPDWCDFWEILNCLKTHETNPQAKLHIEQTLEAFNQCVVSQCNGDSAYWAHGLNINFPSKINYGEVYYPSYGVGLDFKSDCSWDELLTSSLATEKSLIISTKNPLDRLLDSNGFFPPQ